MTGWWLKASGAGLALICATAAHSDALLTDVTLVDVETGTLTPGQSVMIEGWEIAALDWAAGWPNMIQAGSAVRIAIWRTRSGAIIGPAAES